MVNKKKSRTVVAPDNSTVKTRYDRKGREKAYIYKDESGKITGKERVTRPERDAIEYYQNNPEARGEDMIDEAKMGGAMSKKNIAKMGMEYRTRMRGY